jgi:hypothetical protein
MLFVTATRLMAPGSGVGSNEVLGPIVTVGQLRFIDKPDECIACIATFCSSDRHGLGGVFEDAQMLGSLDDTVRCVRAVGDQEGSRQHE